VSAVQRLFTVSALAFAFRLSGAALMLFLQVLISRKLGGDQLGLYAVLLSVCNIVAVVLPLGFQTIAAYFGAAYGSTGRGHALRHFIAQALGQTVLAAVVALVIGVQCMTLLTEDSFQIAQHWHYIVVAALGLALMQLSASVLISLKNAIVGIAGDAILRPVLTALAVFAAFAAAMGTDVVPMLFKFLAAAFMALGISYVLLLAWSVRNIPRPSESLRQERRQWWFYAAPWTLLALASDFFFDIDLLLLTPYLGLTELAVFGIAARLVSLVTFGVNAVYAVGLPDFFSARAKGEQHDFARQIQRINRVALLAAGLLLLGAIFIAPFILQFLGTEFASAATPFAILCLCPLIRALFGPTALLLSMHQQPYAPIPAVVIGFATLLLCNALLVPVHGVNGAALSAVMATLSWTIALWLIARRQTGLDVSAFSGLTRRHQVP
jgi:O-antigen/teichoic acid export membrane protein